VDKKVSDGVGSSIRVRRQHKPTESVTAQVRGIYMEAFPPAERVALEVLIAAVGRGRRLLFTAEAATEIVGFAITMPLPDTGMHLLEYFAVKSEHRGQGIGSILLPGVLGNLIAGEQVVGLILEVRSDQAGDESEREIRRARIAFYRRNGAQLIEDVPQFLAPNLCDGGTIEMRLMWLAAGSAPSKLCGPLLLACIRGIYSECYELSLDDHLVESTLRGLTC
jgi:ribosomal protein S18 acetylase RimI-like enzyme